MLDVGFLTGNHDWRTPQPWQQRKRARELFGGHFILQESAIGALVGVGSSLSILGNTTGALMYFNKAVAILKRRRALIHLKDYPQVLNGATIDSVLKIILSNIYALGTIL